jgi:hypothetical protein
LKSIPFSPCVYKPLPGNDRPQGRVKKDGINASFSNDAVSDNAILLLYYSCIRCLSIGMKRLSNRGDKAAGKGSFSDGRTGIKEHFR